jgi:tRNA(Ile)-lysidine synthase
VSDRLAGRFRRHLASLEAVDPGDRLLVALSGGLDSVVLLHLLRYGAPVPGVELAAAHLDHAMRPGSRKDAAWVRGLARAWGVSLVTRRVPEPPRSEDEARRLRYAFLEEIRRETGSRWIATAHHADDQAETVLFRVLRGTGLRGLAGIAPVRPGDSLLRPLLPWWREELEAYAERHGVPWRTDPTNRDAGYARNALRHELLPLAEERVAPGARRALVRLARLARRDRGAWGDLLDRVLRDVVSERSVGRTVVVRSRLLTYHPEVRARVLRALVRRLGPVLDEAGTRAAMQFTSSGASGRRLALPRGVSLARDFDRLVLTTSDPTDESGRTAESDPVRIREVGTGGEELVIRGRRWLVRWSWSGRPDGRWVERFHPSDAVLPLLLRGWRPGDRIRLGYGSKKVGRVFAEARVPAGERRTRPLLEDGRGRIVWIPGVIRAARGGSRGPDGRDADGPDDPEEDAFTIAIADADD